MVTRHTSHLIRDTLPDVVVKINFSQLHLVRYLMTGFNCNRFITNASDGNVLFITTTGPSRNGRVVKCAVLRHGRVAGSSPGPGHRFELRL